MKNIIKKIIIEGTTKNLTDTERFELLELGTICEDTDLEITDLRITIDQTKYIEVYVEKTDDDDYEVTECNVRYFENDETVEKFTEKDLNDVSSITEQKIRKVKLELEERIKKLNEKFGDSLYNNFNENCVGDYNDQGTNDSELFKNLVEDYDYDFLKMSDDFFTNGSTEYYESLIKKYKDYTEEEIEYADILEYIKVTGADELIEILDLYID